MFKKHKLTKIMMTALMVVCLLTAFSPVLPASATGYPPSPVVPAHKIYNLYATDGIWTMADGAQLYSYGFIGGEAGKPFSYLDPLGNLVTVAGGPPDPTPGPIAAGEAQFSGAAQFPAPLIWCKVGDVVEIRLKNLGVSDGTTNSHAPLQFFDLQAASPSLVSALNVPNDPHSIHLHGLDVDVANDGVPETSVAAVPANGTNAGVPSLGRGNVVVYMFSPKNAGTYFYHCHQEASVHVDQGMYGALIVYNSNDKGATMGPGNAGNLYGFSYTRDVVMLLSDTDLNQHQSEAGVGPTFTGPNQGGFNPVDYHPQYWFINGLSFPVSLHTNFPLPPASPSNNFVPITYASWATAHPGYETLITGSSSKHDKVLLRMINMGFETQPMHMHGYHAKVIGSDQRAWFWANTPFNPIGIGEEKNTITIGSGEEYDLILDLSAQGGNLPVKGDPNNTLQLLTKNYPGADSTFNPSAAAGPGTESRYNSGNNLPESNTLTTNPAIVNPFPNPGEPVVYQGGPPVPQLFVFHNHDDYKATNNGVYPGGMFTAILVSP